MPEILVSLENPPTDEFLKHLAWKTLFQEAHLAFSPPLQPSEFDEGQKIVDRFRFMRQGAHAVVSDVRDMGKKIIGNIVRNLQFLSEASAASSYTNAFKGVPALICGAGPSLQKGLPALPNMSERALIFAGGSALNALTHAGIFPHFAAALDPDPPGHLFRQQAAVQAPLFYQNRVAHRLLKECHSPRIWVPDQVSYPIERFFMEKLGLSVPPFESGWNVATFCLHLAVTLGCNPIIMTGVDLCHAEGKRYSPGVSMAQEASSSIVIEAGKETKADFLLAAQWIEKFVASHPDVSFINASIGGLKLQGMEEATLLEVSARLPLLKVDVEGVIASKLQAQPMPSKEKVDETLEEFQNHLVFCLDSLEKMITLLRKWYPQDASTKGEFILLEVEMQENPLYTYILESLWNVWQWVLCVQEEDLYSRRLQQLLFFQRALQEIQKECAL